MPKKRRGVKKRGTPGRPRTSSRRVAPRRTPRKKSPARVRAGKKAAKTHREHQRTVTYLMKRSKLTRAQAELRYKAGLRFTRADVIFSPADEARSRMAKRYTFRRRKDGSLDTSRAIDR